MQDFLNLQRYFSYSGYTDTNGETNVVLQTYRNGIKVMFCMLAALLIRPRDVFQKTPAVLNAEKMQGASSNWL